MPEPHPIASREPDAIRATLEKMGAVKVRLLMSQGMLVHHLIVPAVDWLAEIEEKKDAAAQGEIRDRP